MRNEEAEPPPRRNRRIDLGAATTAVSAYVAAQAQQADIVQALAPRDDREFRRRIGPNGDPTSISTADMLDHLAGLERAIELHEIPEAARRTLQFDIEEIRADIAGLTQDKAGADSIALVALRLALSPLPILLPLLSNPKQFHGAALIIASVVKTTFIALGLFFNPSANGKVLRRHAMNRDLANNLQALMLLANLVPTPAAQKLSQSVPYNVVVGVIGFVTLMVAFYGKGAIKAQYRLRRHGAALPQRLGDYAQSLSPETKRFLMRMATHTGDQYDALQRERKAFKDAGMRLTNPADWLIGQTLGGMRTLHKDMLRLAGVSVGASEAVSGINQEKVEKSIMLGISGAVLFAPIIPVTGAAIAPRLETIPMVDLLIDYAFSMFYMAAIVRNPSASLQESHDAFAVQVGFSGVMAYCFGANAARGDPVSKGGNAFAGFTVGLSVANLTLATPLGTTTADFVSLLFDKLRRQDKDGTRRVLTALGEQIMRNPSQIPLQDRAGSIADVSTGSDADVSTGSDASSRERISEPRQQGEPEGSSR